MSLPWQDFEELMKWQRDAEYIPSNFECVAHILVTCTCVRFSQQYYDMSGGADEFFLLADHSPEKYAKHRPRFADA